MKTHTLALTDRAQGAVGSLRHQHKVFTLYLGHSPAPGLCANPFQKLARVPRPSNVNRGFISSFHLGRDLLSHLGGGSSGSNWRVTQWT